MVGGGLCVAKKKQKPARKRVESPFAKNLASVLAERELTQRQAAAIAEVSQGTIGDWLAGAMPNDVLAVNRFCKVLNLSFEFMLTGERSEIDVKDISLGEIFEIEEDSMFSGIFEISAKRLKRKK